MKEKQVKLLAIFSIMEDILIKYKGLETCIFHVLLYFRHYNHGIQMDIIQGWNSYISKGGYIFEECLYCDFHSSGAKFTGTSYFLSDPSGFGFEKSSLVGWTFCHLPLHCSIRLLSSKSPSMSLMAVDSGRFISRPERGRG